MSTALKDVLTQFNPRKADGETILSEFEKIAKVVFHGGYFLVNEDVRIYPVEIEFYLHGERKEDKNTWMDDPKMIHRGNKNKVPYFPNTGSFYPHTFGVDVAFENEEQEYRASVLIRKYQYQKGGEVVENPTYLWDDLFGFNTFSGSGLVIKWIDDPSKEQKPARNPRLNLKGKNGKPDPRKWRFTKAGF